MLDRQTPSRLFGAFPPAAPLIRSGLAEAVTGIHNFLPR
jgi:ATP-dependent DNA helicase DinG